MKALSVRAPAPDGRTTSVTEADEPEPGPGQVAIEVAYAGINFINFIDVMARRGDPGYASAWPYVPGLEVAGIIRAVGSGVGGLRVGQRVAAFTPGGGLAEVAIASAEVTVEVPPSVPLPAAAAAPLVPPGLTDPFPTRSHGMTLSNRPRDCAVTGGEPGAEPLRPSWQQTTGEVYRAATTGPCTRDGHAAARCLHGSTCQRGGAPWGRRWQADGRRWAAAAGPGRPAARDTHTPDSGNGPVHQQPASANYGAGERVRKIFCSAPGWAV